MPINGFNYQEFAQMLTEQAGELAPAHFQDFEKQYVKGTILNFATLAGEALYNDNQQSYTAEQAMLVTQIIAEWSFHKSVDTINSGIARDYWDGILQKIAFTIFEIAKQAIGQNLPNDQILQLVEHHVKNAYNEALTELRDRGLIDDTTLNTAANQSNIDAMAAQAQQEAIPAQYTSEPHMQGVMPAQSADNKLLKMASVAILLQRISQDKARVILNKFEPSDTQSIIEYMQMPDLNEKVAPETVARYLQEIKAHLPRSRKLSPKKVIAEVREIFEGKEKRLIEGMMQKERANVKRFVLSAYDGEFFEIPPRIADVVLQHLADSV